MPSYVNASRCPQVPPGSRLRYAAQMCGAMFWLLAALVVCQPVGCSDPGRARVRHRWRHDRNLRPAHPALRRRCAGVPADLRGRWPNMALWPASSARPSRSRRTANCHLRAAGRRPVRRIVAICRASSEDLNAWLVSQGWALAYRHYSTAYVGEEDAAREARRGIWRGDASEPPSYCRAIGRAGSAKPLRSEVHATRHRD
jgi:hypothetical protein